MRKLLYTALTLCLLVVPTSAQATSDVSTTSNFTVSVVEETLGLNIAANTDLGEVIQGSLSKSVSGGDLVTFNNLKFTNTGNTKGVLYAVVQDPVGTNLGKNPGEVVEISLKAEPGRGGAAEHLYAATINPIPEEKKLLSIMSTQDTDGDREHIGPGESLKTIHALWFAFVDQAPLGEISLPIKWVIKTN